MRNIAVSTLAAGGMLACVGTATAMPLDSVPADQSGIHQVRLVCDDWGRCWQAGPRRRVVVREYYEEDPDYEVGAYGYSPTYSYGYPPSYGWRGYGYGYGGPSINVGIGGGRSWW
jgi:hypothetical protein